MEGGVVGAKPIGGIDLSVRREHALFAPILACDVDAAPLHEVSREPYPRRFVVQLCSVKPRIE